MTTNPLLQRYVTERSEPAFAELVRQHIDLVFSAALRQVNGDAAAAQDVTQTVFTDLARKAPSLLRHSSLTGWLYTSTRYISAKTRRSEQRRVAREQEAHAMNQLLQSTESDATWQELRPVLDEAMHELSRDEREAVLLRYFERTPLVEIGTRLGLSEDAARKRVARALDKLRDRLAQRGITSTVAALGLALAERTVSAAPMELSARLSQAAVSAAAGGGAGSMALLWKLLAGGGVAVAAAGLLVLPGMLHRNSHDFSIAPTLAMAQVAPNLADTSSTTTKRQVSAPVPVNPPSSDNTNKLLLRIVTADSSQPIPSVTLDYWLFTGKNVQHKKALTASRLGICEVPVPSDTTELILVSERDGFADTRLQWHADRGQTIPQEYTLRLARAVTIGGTVVDADGNPVAGAKVGFNNRVDASAETAIESSDFGWPFWITAETDSQGRWQISRISKETVRTIDGSASHPQHVRSGFNDDQPETRKQLLAGTFEFHLARGAEVEGSVVDANGQPVPKAKITVGSVGMDTSRETTARADGRFNLTGCVPEKTLLSAEADGFAPTTLHVDLSTNAGPFRLTLQAGKVLRLRVVNTAGMPVPRAYAWLNVFSSGMTGDDKDAPVQTDFNRQTGDDGRLEWSSAPDRELTFDFSARGYLRLGGVKVTPDGQEHVITLPPALTISGTVKDADTGRLIPNFTLVAGWPVTNRVTGQVEGHWSSIDRFWMSFSGGTFHHVFEEPVLGGTPNPGYIFKFQAEGYAPSVSRPVALNEGDVKLDMVLRAAASTTVTVTLPDGRPAANVDIGIVSPTAELKLMPGGFSRVNQQTGGRLLLTDSQGRFTLAPDDSVKSVVAASADGYAEATPAFLADAPVMVLQPWSRLEGTVQEQGRAATNCTLAFRLGTPLANGISSDFMAYQVKADVAGHFTFPQVPPGRHKLVQVIEMAVTPSPNGRGWTEHTLTNLDIHAGQTTTVTVNVSDSPFFGSTKAGRPN